MLEFALVAGFVGLFTAVVIRLRRAGRRPCAAIGDLRPGWAEVHGHARASSPSLRQAPISGREGLGWRVLVEQESGVRGWEPVVDLSDFGDFEVEDESGSIRVRAADTPVNLEVAERRGQGGPFAPPPAAVERLIRRSADPQGVLFHKGFRWREWVLEEGREVFVRARVVSEPGDESLGYRTLSERLVLAGGAARPIEVAE